MMVSEIELVRTFAHERSRSSFPNNFTYSRKARLRPPAGGLRRGKGGNAMNAKKRGLLFWMSLVLGIVIAVIAIDKALYGAEMPPVPYLTNDDERAYIGQGLYTDNGIEVTIRPDLAEEVVLYIVGSPEVRDENDKIVPRIIEIREFIPEVPLLQMPIRRLMWDADGDGYADYISIVVGYKNGEPIFRTMPLGPDMKRKMSEQEHFRVTLPPMKES